MRAIVCLAAAIFAASAAPALAWKYEERSDAMTSAKTRTAFVLSDNEFSFSPPYGGKQRAMFMLRAHPRYGNDAMLRIQRGQFLCRLDGCNVLLRFDDGDPVTLRAVGPSDSSTTVLFIRDFDQVLERLSLAKRVLIEAQFYQEGPRVLRFNVAALQWPGIEKARDLAQQHEAERAREAKIAAEPPDETAFRAAEQAAEQKCTSMGEVTDLERIRCEQQLRYCAVSRGMRPVAFADCIATQP